MSKLILHETFKSTANQLKSLKDQSTQLTKPTWKLNLPNNKGFPVNSGVLFKI